MGEKIVAIACDGRVTQLPRVHGAASSAANPEGPLDALMPAMTALGLSSAQLFPARRAVLGKFEHCSRAPRLLRSLRTQTRSILNGSVSEAVDGQMYPLISVLVFACCTAVPLWRGKDVAKIDLGSDRGISPHRWTAMKTQTEALDWGGTDSAGPREEMEDAWCIRLLSGNVFYVGVFDGHGGSASSTYLKNNLVRFVDEVGPKMCESANKGVLPCEYNLTDENPLAVAFERADSALLDHLGSLGDPECWSGSTATVCFLSRSHIIVANVGDSRAVIGRKGRSVDLTNDHRPTGSSTTGRSEITRIMQSGGWVSQMRVCGILAVTRAFGDYEFKGGRQELLQELAATGSSQTGSLQTPPVVATPDVRVYERTPEDDFLIVATDGLWDVINSAQAITFVRTMVKRDKSCSMQEVASALIDRALKSRTQDNISCVVVDVRTQAMTT